MSSKADLYDRVQHRYQGRDALTLIDDISLKNGSSVLDLGCGTGYLASVVAENVGPEGKVTGIDPNKERLRVAQRKYAGQQNLQFLEGTAEDIPGGPYDAIVSTYVLHWIKDKKSAINNVYETLKTGGIFAFICPDTDAESVVHPPVRYCSTDVYTGIATECGFEIQFMSDDPMEFTFDNFDEYIDWFSASLDVNIEPITYEELTKSFAVDPCMRFRRLMFILKK